MILPNMWKTYFERIYFSVDGSHHKYLFQSRIKAATSDNWVNISLDDIIDVVLKLTRNKTAGPDTLTTEAFIYGTPRLFAHMSILFSWLQVTSVWLFSF